MKPVCKYCGSVVHLEITGTEGDRTLRFICENCDPTPIRTTTIEAESDVDWMTEDGEIPFDGSLPVDFGFSASDRMELAYPWMN